MERSSESRSERENLKGWRSDLWRGAKSESSRRRWRGVVWKARLGHVNRRVFLRTGICDVYRRAVKPKRLAAAAMRALQSELGLW